MAVRLHEKKMVDMSMAETSAVWGEGVSLMAKGHFQAALMKFIVLERRSYSSQLLITSGRNLFNIGQTYVALGKPDCASEVFEHY